MHVKIDNQIVLPLCRGAAGLPPCHGHAAAKSKSQLPHRRGVVLSWTRHILPWRK